MVFTVIQKNLAENPDEFQILLRGEIVQNSENVDSRVLASSSNFYLSTVYPSGPTAGGTPRCSMYCRRRSLALRRDGVTLCPAYSLQPKIEDDVEKVRSAEQHLGRRRTPQKKQHDVAHTPSTSASSSIGCRAVRPVQCVYSS